MDAYIKQETPEPKLRREVINIPLSSSSDCSSESDVELNPKKKQRVEAVLPVGFLDPIRQHVKKEKAVATADTAVALLPACRQFWKAGNYEGSADAAKFSDEDMDHLRVHPKFLHSNATSHKWALGAFAELLDNALDENCNGANYVLVDVLENTKEKSKMVMVQDNGGGMTPDKMRRCMSLGYSAKSKMSNTIGQYGNGFKTSTMRLGADVIVFSRCQGKYGGNSTQSIGLLSFSFLRGTGKEDIVVPMIDYEKKGGGTWRKYVRSSSDCWQRNLETIAQWSPYDSEEDLLQQFDFISEQGTRIIIYNLWEDDEGSPELDFDTDQHDIQIRGNDRDDKKVETANKFPSTRHFLTYRHSLRSYASILYYKMPPGFRIILRGKDVEHYDIVDDLIHINKLVYKPAAYADSKDPNMSAKVTLGFVKDASHHIDIQGFNVYHKNRLIKPFWRVWSAAGSDGRGVVGALEANFVEPAHDKQGFERTIALSRLEARLKDFQKNYWCSNCQLVGYAQRRAAAKTTTCLTPPEKQVSPNSSCKRNSAKRNIFTNDQTLKASANKEAEFPTVTPLRSYPEAAIPLRAQPPQPDVAVEVKTANTCEDGSVCPSLTNMVIKLKHENHGLKLSLKKAVQDLQQERKRTTELENAVEHTKKMMAKMDEEQEMFVSAFSEERGRREEEEQNLRRRLKEASGTIQALLDKLKALEAAAGSNL